MRSNYLLLASTESDELGYVTDSTRDALASLGVTALQLEQYLFIARGY